MSKISKIEAREILDSRGNPTLEVETYLEEDLGRFSVPSGASTGKHEALEKRDGDPKRFGGKGVKEVAERIEKEIAPEIINKDFDQKSLDDFLIKLDGTSNKSNLGANTILGISMSFAKAEANRLGIPLWKHTSSLSDNEIPFLPTPMVNILNGGVHADNNLDFQEFMIVPLRDESFAEKIRSCSEVFHNLEKILKENGLSTAVGDEGGFAPKVSNHRNALEFIVEAIEKSSFEPGKGFGIALDVAASEFMSGNEYVLKSENQKFNSRELLEYYENLIQDFPIVSIEDPFGEDDWEGFALFTEKFGKDLMVVGDDLLVTNLKRLRRGTEEDVANAILIKLNQVGTLSETLKVIEFARNDGWQTIISHRSGETEDTSIDHLAVGTHSRYIKTGSVSRGERTAKYNELIRIEESLKNS